ncbi:hypothetical protein [Candidatus Xianfuyuplasma coldseepsis]|uniref:Uncharacterized protein n=1 Tax=Candidatus Xianfuyuplasma coldseepsis TaxID=2782163 RepID=A0A7L7KPU4_9MOLU|nr:hypothetical protein [Xianfuyuplasma coldseepsis]QMS84811.1 hypothetical protein G4Z02_03265 [Xianfuyuplasma coldseepsis]
MKKLVIAVFLGIFAITLSACSSANDNIDNTVTEELLGSEESLATLSYLSTGFLDFESPTVATTDTMFLANDSGGWTTIEDELDVVNVYFDRLKALIDNGVDGFGSVTEEVSDNELYDYKLTFTVNEEVYVIYYSIDADTGEMTGIIVLGEAEYTFEVIDNMKEYEYQEEEKEQNEQDTENEEQNANQNEPDDEVDDEEEEEDYAEEGETKMTLIAYSGDDYIRIIYKTETEEDETEVKFIMEKFIGGVEENVKLKISQEEGEYKVSITEGDDSYSFKQETEDDEIVYKLQYRVDNTVGMVTIKVVTDEFGEVTYSYHIVEGGKEKDVEKPEPKSHGFDDDDEVEQEEEEETENNEV